MSGGRPADAVRSTGKTAETFESFDRAAFCYEQALKHDPYCVDALTQVAGIYRKKEQFGRAADFFGRLLSLQEGSGEVWGALGPSLVFSSTDRASR